METTTRPKALAAGADRATLAALFTKHDMTLLGPPLTPD